MSELSGFKFVTTLVLVLKTIESKDKTKYGNFYSNSKAEIIINENDIDDVFESFFSKIISNIQKSLGKVSRWITDHAVSISKDNTLAGTSYIKLPEELDHRRKGLVNIQNIDNNECFKWSIVRYLNPANNHPARITKAGQDFAKKLDFKGIKFPVKIREKLNSIGISVFGNESKEKHTIYISKKCCEEKHVDLLLIGEEAKRHYVTIKDFNTFMYDHTLNR